MRCWSSVLRRCVRFIVFSDWRGVQGVKGQTPCVWCAKEQKSLSRSRGWVVFVPLIFQCPGGALPELAPAGGCAANGCRGFIGPVPLPLWMRGECRVGIHLLIQLSRPGGQQPKVYSGMGSMSNRGRLASAGDNQFCPYCLLADQLFRRDRVPSLSPGPGQRRSRPAGWAVQASYSWPPAAGTGSPRPHWRECPALEPQSP